MARAIELSIENVRSGQGGPFGAVVVKDGKIIAEARIALPPPTIPPRTRKLSPSAKRVRNWASSNCWTVRFTRRANPARCVSAQSTGPVPRAYTLAPPPSTPRKPASTTRSSIAKSPNRTPSAGFRWSKPCATKPSRPSPPGSGSSTSAPTSNFLFGSWCSKPRASGDYSTPRNAYLRRNSALSTQISGLISLRRPVNSLRNVNESNPRLRPVAILNVSGVAINVKKAGTESV
jgi:hypothetical protein